MRKVYHKIGKYLEISVLKTIIIHGSVLNMTICEKLIIKNNKVTYDSR